MKSKTKLQQKQTSKTERYAMLDLKSEQHEASQILHQNAKIKTIRRFWFFGLFPANEEK